MRGRRVFCDQRIPHHTELLSATRPGPVRARTSVAPIARAGRRALRARRAHRSRSYKLPLSDYATSAQLWQFVAGNLSLSGYYERLPGLFLNAPMSGAVDGSIWTLHYEAWCYLAVLILGMSRLLNRWTALATFALLLAASYRWMGGVAVEFGSYFAAGAALYLWKPSLRWWLAAACIPLLVASFLTGGFRLACATAGAYLIIYVALAVRPFASPTRSADLSYGVYIWAWPVQQCLAMALPGLAWWGNVALALPVVLTLAWASWEWVEKPAMAWGRVTSWLYKVAYTTLSGVVVLRPATAPSSEQSARRTRDVSVEPTSKPNP